MKTEEVKQILGEYNYFGTDTCEFNSNSEGIYLVSGTPYGISDSQYDESLGDITRSKAEVLLLNYNK